jgi:hypothetical protein
LEGSRVANEDIRANGGFDVIRITVEICEIVVRYR